MKLTSKPHRQARWSSLAQHSAALASLCLLGTGALVGCGSGSDAGFSDGSDSGSSGALQAGRSNSAAGSVSAGGSGGAAQAGSGTAAATAGGNAAGSAAVCTSGGACTACLCMKCPTQVSTCEATPGCQAIAECVASSRCQGAACYCGTADTIACAAGSANGPCRDAILNAPGGHKPTLTNQSAGPAADAAIAVANCGSNSSSGCTASCQ